MLQNLIRLLEDGRKSWVMHGELFILVLLGNFLAFRALYHLEKSGYRSDIETLVFEVYCM